MPKTKDLFSLDESIACAICKTGLFRGDLAQYVLGVGICCPHGCEQEHGRERVVLDSYCNCEDYPCCGHSRD